MSVQVCALGNHFDSLYEGVSAHYNSLVNKVLAKGYIHQDGEDFDFDERFSFIWSAMSAEDSQSRSYIFEKVGGNGRTYCVGIHINVYRLESGTYEVVAYVL